MADAKDIKGIDKAMAFGEKELGGMERRTAAGPGLALDSLRRRDVPPSAGGGHCKVHAQTARFDQKKDQ